MKKDARRRGVGVTLLRKGVDVGQGVREKRSLTRGLDARQESAGDRRADSNPGKEKGWQAGERGARLWELGKNPGGSWGLAGSGIEGLRDGRLRCRTWNRPREAKGGGQPEQV